MILLTHLRKETLRSTGTERAEKTVKKKCVQKKKSFLDAPSSDFLNYLSKYDGLLLKYDSPICSLNSHGAIH